MRKLAAALATVILGIAFGLAVQGMTVDAQTGIFVGSGWTGTYYSDVNFTTVAFTRLEPAGITYQFANGSPGTGVPADNFSVRWTSSQTFPSPGIYRFTVFRDEDAQLTVNGQTIIPFAGGIGSSTYSVDLFLNAGTYPIQLDYREFTGNAFVQLSWQLVGAGGTPGTVGPTATFTRTALPPIPPGALTATVIRASVLNTRDAPSLGGGVIGRIRRGETYAVVGRDEDARWFLLQLGGYQGWSWGYYLFINGNEFNAPVRSPFGTIGVPPGVQDTGVVAQAQSTMNLRPNPSVAGDRIGRITWGAFLPVIGRTADGFWWQVVWKGTVGWIYSPYSKIIQGDLNAVPVK
jgi:uncharacterized protein YgiM (DUF1202 family)